MTAAEDTEHQVKSQRCSKEERLTVSPESKAGSPQGYILSVRRGKQGRWAENRAKGRWLEGFYPEGLRFPAGG